MFSNSYTGPLANHPELDPALTVASTPVDIMMAQQMGKHPAVAIEEPQYALPPISQDFARPSLSETRRPATSAGVLHNLITTGSHVGGGGAHQESPEFSAHGEFDPSPDINQEQAYTHLGGMIMSHQQQQHQQQQHAQHQQPHLPQPPQMHIHQNRPDLRAQNSGYAVALPPISHDFARPSTSETRRPATSAGILQRSMAPGTFGAMSAFSSLDAQRRASIGLGTINEHQSVTPQPQHQGLPQGLSTQQQQQSSGYGMTPAQANYAHALEAHARRQSDMASGYHGMFAHSIDGIDPNLTGMLNYLDITRRFSVPTLTTLPFQRPTTPSSALVDPAAAGQSALNSARSLNGVRFNPVKMETAGAVVDGGYDTRPGSSGGPIFPTDYRMGLHGGFDPATGTPNGFFPGAGDMTPQQQHQLYTLHSAASGVFPSGSYSSAGSVAGAVGATGGGMLDHRNGSYSSVSLDSTRHDSMTESSRNPSLPDIYLHQHLNNRRMSMDAVARNPGAADIYLNQHLQRRPSTGGNGGIHITTLADAAAHQMGLLNHNEDPSSGPVHKKRPRRKFDQIERLYLCGYEGCNKSYGTLNHLNAHVSMQKHGEKRRPEEFKEIRAAWRKRKKEEAKEVAEHHAVVHGAPHHHLDIERLEKDAYEAQGKWLAH